jgi:hypothetical protein
MADTITVEFRDSKDRGYPKAGVVLPLTEYLWVSTLTTLRAPDEQIEFHGYERTRESAVEAVYTEYTNGSARPWPLPKCLRCKGQKGAVLYADQRYDRTTFDEHARVICDRCRMESDARFRSEGGEF